MSLPAALRQYTDRVKAQIVKILAEKDIIGADNVKGSYYRNIFKGFIRTVDTTESGPHVEGDFTAVGAALADNANIYLHIKLPLNKNVHSRMFWLKIRGYSFGSAQRIDTTAVGYCYVTTQQLLNTNIASVQTAELYADTNGNIVLSLLFPSVYYTTLEADSMIVGNGIAIRRGELQTKFSKSNRVVF